MRQCRVYKLFTPGHIPQRFPSWSFPRLSFLRHPDISLFLSCYRLIDFHQINNSSIFACCVVQQAKKTSHAFKNERGKCLTGNVWRGNVQDGKSVSRQCRCTIRRLKLAFGLKGIGNALLCAFYYRRLHRSEFKHGRLCLSCKPTTERGLRYIADLCYNVIQLVLGSKN